MSIWGLLLNPCAGGWSAISACVLIKARPQFFDAGYGFENEFTIYDDGGHRCRSSELFREFGMPCSAGEFLGDNPFPSHPLAVIGSNRFDHTGHVLAGDSMGPFMKHFQMDDF